MCSCSAIFFYVTDVRTRIVWIAKVFCFLTVLFPSHTCFVAVCIFEPRILFVVTFFVKLVFLEWYALLQRHGTEWELVHGPVWQLWRESK